MAAGAEGCPSCLLCACLCSLPGGHMHSVLPLPAMPMALPPGTSLVAVSGCECLGAAGVCGCCSSQPSSCRCFVPAGDGSKTSRTTTMESSYVKRSDSKSFSCPFPIASLGCNPGASLLLSCQCPGVGRVLPSWHSCPQLLPRASFLPFSLQMATALSFKLNHPTAPHPKRQAGEWRCLWGQLHMVPVTNLLAQALCPACSVLTQM